MWRSRYKYFNHFDETVTSREGASIYMSNMESNLIKTEHEINSRVEFMLEKEKDEN